MYIDTERDNSSIQIKNKNSFLVCFFEFFNICNTRNSK